MSPLNNFEIRLISQNRNLGQPKIYTRRHHSIVYTNTAPQRMALIPDWSICERGSGPECQQTHVQPAWDETTACTAK